MPRSSVHQSAFIGGEFSPLAQGRSDLPQYKQGMSLSLNGHPIEEGAWVKRSAFEFVVPTRGRTYGTMLPFDGSATCSFGMLFTSGNVQFITSSASLVFDNTVSTITASVDLGTSCEITVTPAQSGWAEKDQLMFVFPDVSSPLYPYPIDLEAGLRGRLLTILSPGGVADSTHFYLANDVGVNLGNDPSHQPWTLGTELIGAQVMRVLNFPTPYTTVTQLQNLRAVQIEYQSIIFDSQTPLQVIEITTEPTVGPAGADPVFSIDPLTMIDGPYLDPLNDTATVSGYSGTITVTMTSTHPFVSSDVGRLIRLFSQPALWAAGTAYTPGNQVTDANGEWWTNLVANTGTPPGQPIVSGGVQQLAWAPQPFAGSWAWGTITIVDHDNEVHVALDSSIPNMNLQSANGTTLTTVQLGVFCPSIGYPTDGTYHQGRLFVGGAVPNRFDTTVSNGVVGGVATWSPTDPYGNVTDDSGMSEIFNSRYVNNIQWFVPSPNGIVMGTLNGEFLVSASQQNDPITPTDIQSWMVTKYGSAFVEPVLAGMSIIYVQKHGQKMMEYLADAFSQKYSGRHLNEWSKHLAASGVAQLVYQEEPFPCVWARMNNGLLTGITYRRFNRFVAEPPNIAGAHWHMHGRQRAFTSLCVIPAPEGRLERLFAVTNDVNTVLPGSTVPDNYFVEVMQPFFDQNQSILQGWFNDEAPGAGPGADPAYDCGGGNAASFGQSGALIGSDTTTPDVSALFPYDTGIPVGNDLSVNLALREASFFDGQTMLYTLPPFPSRGAQADQTGVSLSIWIARQDAPLQTGALFSSPALSFDEATGAATIVSNILGGPANVADSPGTMLARTTTGLDQYPNAPAEVGDGDVIQGGTQPWQHLMISAKTAGDGTISVIAALNDTVIANVTGIGNLANTKDGWPFLTQPGAVKEPGLCVWAIGGTEAANSKYDFTDVLGNIVSDPGVYSAPTLAQLVNTLLAPSIRAHRSINSQASVLTTFAATDPRFPSLVQYANSLVGRMRTAQGVVKVQGSGGLSNVPVGTPLGAITGYRGSVAELWIKPGFIDWTSSTNRNKLHFFDTVTGWYKPLSLGPSGGGTTLGSPYIYLSGPPSLWTVNRASGKRLAVMGNGMGTSPLAPPQPA